MATAPVSGPGVVLGVGGPYEPLRGYIGVPSPFTDVIDADGTEVADADGTLVSERVLSNPNLIAGLAPFFLVEITASRPAQDLVQLYGWGIVPWGALSILPGTTSQTGTFYASDIGYRTEAPVIPYPPLMSAGFSLDARIPLSPAQVGIVWGWGTLNLINAGRQFDGLVQAWNTEGRAIRVLYGVKTYDDTRGLFQDPRSDDLIDVFTGVGAGWSLNEFMLSLQVRDASYWLDRPLQRSSYGGTGTYDGDAETKGVLIPKTRGKAFNVTLTLIDRDNLIYQYNDGPGEVLALYEGGAETITFQADTSNLYSGSTTSGQYRTDDSRGLIQLGVAPAENAALTADVIGHFPTAGEQLIAADIVRYILTEDMAVPAGFVDTASFDQAGTDYPYEAGWHWGPDAQIDGATAAGQCLAAFGAKVVPAVDGTLRCLILQAVQTADATVATFDTASIIRCEPRPLSVDLVPAIYRARCAYQHNYTVQTGGLLGATTDEHRQFVQVADRFATWTDGDVSLAYATAQDLAPFGGGLTTEADAQDVADRIGALFGVRRWVFDVELPIVEAVSVEFGDVLDLTYPNHVMTHGVRAKVVGRSFDADGLSMTLTVIV